VLLLAALPRVTRTLQPAERTSVLAGVLGRFSPVALAAVAVLLATGVAQAIVHLDRFGDLLHTAFGRAVLIKALLLLALIALGALNRQRTLPQLSALATGGAAPGAPGRVIRRTLRAEVAFMLAALGVTAALVSYPPPSAIATGPYSASKRMGPLQLELTVDPARTGANAVHLYVFRARDGAPFTGTKELRLSATLPAKGIGPLAATVRRAGPGHYVADALALTPGGTWRLDVADRVSDFDEYATRIEVPVR
jgi:copper transport protein